MKSDSRTSGWLVIGLAAAIAGCSQSDHIAIECGQRVVTIDDVVSAVADDPELATEERIDQAIAGQLLRCAVLAEPMGRDEAADIERMSRWRRAQRCVDIEIKQRLASRVDVVEEARARFEENPEAWLPPESFQLQLIFLPDDQPSSEDLANRILTQIRERPESFAELARAHSKSDTAAQGGFTKPMPGTTVDPEMREAIRQHQSREPFLVATGNGRFIARVVQYWPPVQGSWEEAAPNVIRNVGREIVRDEIETLMTEVRNEHRVEIARQLFVEPLVPVEEAVYSIDGRSISVSDLFPGMSAGDQVPGPVVGATVGALRRWYEPAVALSCFDEETTLDETLLFQRRLGPALTAAVDGLMDEEIRRFADTHHDLLVAPNTYLFDLWVFPFASDSPYGDLRDYEPAMEAIRSGDFEIEDPAVRAFLRVEMSEPQLASYEPAIRAVLDQIEAGSFSEMIRSRRLRSFVLVRLEHKNEGRTLSPDSEEDRGELIRRFLGESRDEVIDAWTAQLRHDCRVAPRLEERVRRALEQRTSVLPG